jgi:hypothetical protein
MTLIAVLLKKDFCVVSQCSCHSVSSICSGSSSCCQQVRDSDRNFKSIALFKWTKWIETLWKRGIKKCSTLDRVLNIYFPHILFITNFNIIYRVDQNLPSWFYHSGFTIKKALSLRILRLRTLMLLFSIFVDGQDNSLFSPWRYVWNGDIAPVILDLRLSTPWNECRVSLAEWVDSRSDVGRSVEQCYL